jgi:hypothetical protein
MATSVGINLSHRATPVVARPQIGADGKLFASVNIEGDNFTYIMGTPTELEALADVLDKAAEAARAAEPKLREQAPAA